MTHPRTTISLLLTLCILALLPLAAPAQLVSGPDWIVAYSLPTQSDFLTIDGQYAIRDLLTQRIGQLQKGHSADIATFTFSGGSMETGAAGPILDSISMALDRGASIHFVADSKIQRGREHQPGLSLSSLSWRRNNPLQLSVSPSRTLMHHKVALFQYDADEQWSFVGSGNLTGAANSRQWNIAVLIRNPDLYNAYAAEMAEFRQNRFSGKKQRDHDRTHFRLQDSWGASWVRFGPFPRKGAGGNAEHDIRNIFKNAEEEIYFAMHRFNRQPLRRELVLAADRGIKVYGVIPESDRGTDSGALSRKTVNYFLNPSNYATTNRVILLPARSSALSTARDAGELDLVHTKYAIVDPNGRRPFVIHGASNWTTSGLVAPNVNDESILFLRHRDMAQAFLAHFQRMTGTRAAQSARPPAHNPPPASDATKSPRP